MTTMVAMVDIFMLPGAEARKTSRTFSSCQRPTFPMTADIWSPPSLLGGGEEEGRAGSVSFTTASSSVSVSLLPMIALCCVKNCLQLRPGSSDQCWILLIGLQPNPGKKINWWFQAILSTCFVTIDGGQPPV